MAKADDAIKELQRRLGRLARLDGAIVHTAEGPVLLARVEVQDPFALLAACEAAGLPSLAAAGLPSRAAAGLPSLTAAGLPSLTAAGLPSRAAAGLPSLAALRAGLRCTAEPEHLTATRVARAQRDLRALAASHWLALVRAAPRHFRGLGPLDEQWLAARAARLDTLGHALRPGAATATRSPAAATATRGPGAATATRGTATRGLNPATATGPGSAGPREPVPEEFVPVLTLVADLHGAHAADALLTWLDRSAALGARRRRAAQARLDALVSRLDDPQAPRREPPALAAMLDAAAAELGRLGRLPGRAAARRLGPLLRGVLAWPAAPAHGPSDAALAPPDAAAERDAPDLWDTSPAPPDAAPVLEARQHVLEASRQVPAAPAARAFAPGLGARSMAILLTQVRSQGAELVQALGSTRSPARLTALRRVLGAHALAFPQPPGAPPPPPLAVDELGPAERRLREAVAAGLPSGLPLGRALWLLRLPVDARIRAVLAVWVADGLAPALVDRVAALQQLERLAALDGDAALAAAYAGWLVDLVPHYQRLGITLELRPEHFARLHATHRGGLALLAHCLIVHHVPDERAADARLARLRATLGLFAARPRRAEALLADLSRAPAGLGRELLPEFAAWLADAPLLDRYCHLCALADEPVTLSGQLRRDFDRERRIAGQREFLAALPDPSPAQRARLAAVTAELAEPGLTDRGWTLRRLTERCEALQARAFARHLDLLLREVLAEAIGAVPPALSPAWRDALRFYLGSAARNRALLGDLLRFAAANPGRPIAPTLARNQAWLGRAGARLRAEAWLAPRRRVLELDGQRHILTIEDDPLEVLRMGMPFDTCLDLDDGFNADSTVLNAVDINKRVLYLRDARGSVVARKLIAISSDFTLIGYRLYSARGGDERPALAAAVLELCRALADDCGLSLAADGVPETIHPGFWYDDGAESWDDAPDRTPADLAPHFAALGVAPPATLSLWALRQASAWRAHAVGDLEAAIALVPHLHGAEARSALAGLIAARLGPRALVSRARHEPTLALVHLCLAAREGPVALLRALTRLPDPGALAREVGEGLDHAPPSAELARALLAAAAHTRRRTTRFDDHGLEHRSFHIGPHLACMPLAEALASCAALESLWDWICAEAPGCSDCRVWGEQTLFEGLAASFVRDPDPAAVLLALRGRHGALAQRGALHIAARFSLAPRPRPLRPGAGLSWFTRLAQRPLPAPQALRALRDLQRTCPALARGPELFAALVRQAGPAGPHTGLPTPHEPPFALLGEFLLHLPDPAALLGPWLDPDCAPAAWKPDRWELHVHRRCLTPWRRRLARLAAADPDADEPRRWLARLGDLETLARLGSRGHLAHARDIAWQLGLGLGAQAAPQDMSRGTPDLAPRGDLRGREPVGIDPLLLHAALRALTAAPGDRHALDLCLAADLEPAVWHELLAQTLPPTGLPAPATLPLLQRLLAGTTLRGLPLAQIARLAAVPALHGALLDLLELELRGYRVTTHALYSQLERHPSDDPAARDAFLTAWLVRTGDDAASIDTPLGAHDGERFLACLAAWTEHAPPATLLAIYRQLDHHQCARLLQRLLALPEHRDRDLLELLTLARDHVPHGEDEAVTHAWLLAALDARYPTTTAPPPWASGS
jgi:hypothetical protein